MRKFQTDKEFRPKKHFHDVSGQRIRSENPPAICLIAVVQIIIMNITLASAHPLCFGLGLDQRTLARNLLSETCMVNSKKISYAAKQGCCQFLHHSGEHSGAQWFHNGIPSGNHSNTFQCQDYKQLPKITTKLGFSLKLSCPKHMLEKTLFRSITSEASRA